MSFEQFNMKCKEVFGVTASGLLYQMEDFKQRIESLEQAKTISDPVIGAAIAKLESLTDVVVEEVKHVDLRSAINNRTALIINNAKSNRKTLEG